MVTRRRMLMVPPAAAAAAAALDRARAGRASPGRRRSRRRPSPSTAALDPRAVRHLRAQPAGRAQHVLADGARRGGAPQLRRGQPPPAGAVLGGTRRGDRLRREGVEAGVRQPAAAGGGERLRGPLHRPGVQRLHLPVGLVLHDAVRALRRAGVSVRPDARQLLRQAAPGRVHLPRDRAGARRRSLPALRSVVDGTERAVPGPSGSTTATSAIATGWRACFRCCARTTSGCARTGRGRTAPTGRRAGAAEWTTSRASPPARRTPTRSTTTGA